MFPRLLWPELGEVVEGTVIDVKPDEIFLNIGYKSDGIITRNEYTNDVVGILMMALLSAFGCHTSSTALHTSTAYSLSFVQLLPDGQVLQSDI